MINENFQKVTRSKKTFHVSLQHFKKFFSDQEREVQPIKRHLLSFGSIYLFLSMNFDEILHF